MTPEERAQKLRQLFNKAKNAGDRTKEKADGYFQVIKGYVDRGLDKIENKTSKYNGDYHTGGIMAPPPPKKELPIVEETPPAQRTGRKKKPKPGRYEL